MVAISDTHARHEKGRPIPEGDILIHAGDWSNVGTVSDIVKFRTFFEGQPHPYKIFIAGNHDITMHKSFYVSEKGYKEFHKHSYKSGTYKGLSPSEYADKCIDLAINGSNPNEERSDVIEYLEDSSYSIPNPVGNQPNLHIYGSPWQPTFCDWAFNGEPDDLRTIWAQIPADVDILITHGPPHNILDKNCDDFPCGCPILREEIMTRIRPRIHIFGHIHEGYGESRSITILLVILLLFLSFV